MMRCVSNPYSETTTKKYCDLFRDGKKGGKLETLRQTAKNQIYIFQTAKMSIIKTVQFNTVIRIIKSLELHFIMFF